MVVDSKIWRMLLLGLGLAGMLFLCGCGESPKESGSVPIDGESRVEGGELGDSFVNSLGLKFVRLPDSSVDAFMCVVETRNRDFIAFLKESGRPPTSAAMTHPDHPANFVSWNDAVSFCNWLTNRERAAGRIGSKDRYRLPWDVEWTLAAGGKRYPWGDSWPNLAEIPSLPGYMPKDSSIDFTTKVGTTPANVLGIHDMGGNVAEWTMNWYRKEMNPSEIRLEYERLGSDGGGRNYKVLRGMSWVFFDPLNLLTDYRYINEPHVRGGFYGFRMVFEVYGGKNDIQTYPHPSETWPPKASQGAGLLAARDLYRRECLECHHYFDPASYNEAKWDDWFGRMRGRAKISQAVGDQMTPFIDFVRGK